MNRNIADQSEGRRPKWVLRPAAMIAILGLAAGIASLIHYRAPRPEAERAAVFISEFQAVNTDGIRDADGDLSEWIELANLGDSRVDLAGWYLTDDFRDMKKWRIPAFALDPGERAVIFASGKDRVPPFPELHTNFRLREDGEYLALVRPKGVAVHEYFPRYPRQFPWVSYGMRPDHPGRADEVFGSFTPVYHHFGEPTPGSPNRGVLRGRVADTTFDLHRGYYSGRIRVSIRTATPDATIRYTTNGSAPTPEVGRIYTGPIDIDRTTVLRAAAYKPAHLPTNVDTQTFIFPDRVPDQDGTGFPATWGERNDRPVTADYGMDPEITGSDIYRARLRTGLRSLPSLSVVLDPGDLFGADRGIYCHPTERGRAWERAASVEFIPSDAEPGFQVGAGVRIQGGWNRRPEESPKHSLRLIFRREYGDRRLTFPLFGPEAPTEFDTLILRGGSNNSWLHWNGEERRRGDLIRDQWMRDAHRDMGHPSARGRFVHLYLNGLYWGVYNLAERPDQRFAAAHFGGLPEQYDARNAGDILGGDAEAWDELFRICNRGLGSVDAFRAVEDRIHMDGFIDFMLLNLYGANADWDRVSNWYAARRRTPPGPFHFFVWDAERTLENVDDNRLDTDDDRSPTRLFRRLRENAEFRLRFADHVQEHCLGDGALDSFRAKLRYSRHAAVLKPAMVAESARWGDYRRDVHPYKVGPYELYTPDDHWRPEVNRLLNDYFPRRAAVLVGQLREAGLFPNIDAPRLVLSDDGYRFAHPEFPVYFTRDGSDPRGPDGNPSPSAVMVSGKDEKWIARRRAADLRARAVDRSGAVPEWSALTRTRQNDDR